MSASQNFSNKRTNWALHTPLTLGTMGAVSLKDRMRFQTYHGSTRWIRCELTFNLVGGWTNPFEKYANVKLERISPEIGVKNKQYLKPPPSNHLRPLAPYLVGKWAIVCSCMVITISTSQVENFIALRNSWKHKYFAGIWIQGYQYYLECIGFCTWNS